MEPSAAAKSAEERALKGILKKEVKIVDLNPSAPAWVPPATETQAAAAGEEPDSAKEERIVEIENETPSAGAQGSSES